MVQTVIEKASTRYFQKLGAFKIVIGNTIDTITRLNCPKDLGT